MSLISNLHFAIIQWKVHWTTESYLTGYLGLEEENLWAKVSWYSNKTFNIIVVKMLPSFIFYGLILCYIVYYGWVLPSDNSFYNPYIHSHQERSKKSSVKFRFRCACGFRFIMKSYISCKYCRYCDLRVYILLLSCYVFV